MADPVNISDPEMKTPLNDLLYDFIDALHSGCKLRVDAPDGSSTNIGYDAIGEIVYAVEKHMRKR